MQKFLSYCFVASVVLMMAACGGSTDNGNTTNTDTSKTKTTGDTTHSDLTHFKYDMVISNIPIPFDILSSLNSAKFTFKKEMLNPLSNTDKYSQNNSKAVNLGIYGADIAYIATFEQYTDIAPYLKSAKKLADDLGIPLAFDQRALTMYDKYKTNRDSMEKLIFESYSEVDKTLKSNERLGLATLVITGGWIEGFYTTTQTLGNSPKDEKTAPVYKKLWEQKNHLDKIYDLLNQFAGDHAYDAVIADLKSVKDIYSGLKVKTEVSQDEVQKLSEKVDAIRKKVTAG